MHGMAKTEDSKIPAVTLGFWIIKIAATTLGETGGDALSMTMKLGYAVSTGIFFAIFLVKGDKPAFFIAVQYAVALMIIVKHHQNIGRLLNGTENRLGSKRGGSTTERRTA